VAAFYAQIQAGELTPSIPQMSMAFDILNEAMVSTYDRDATPETAMRRAARRVRDEIRAPVTEAGVLQRRSRRCAPAVQAMRAGWRQLAPSSRNEPASKCSTRL
jgi:hypothetical protein